MSSLAQLEARIRALEKTTDQHKDKIQEHGSELRGHKEWRNNRQGDGNIREENGMTVLGLRTDNFRPGGSSSGTTITLDVIINGARFTYNFLRQ